MRRAAPHRGRSRAVWSWMPLAPALWTGGVLAVGLLSGCERHTATPAPVSAWAKVGLDLADVDENGLRGPADGKVSVAFEFAIPDGAKFREEVRAVAPGVRFMPGSRGRVGAAPGECLCVGETGPGFREMLGALAELPYVKRIIPCVFE